MYRVVQTITNLWLVLVLVQTVPDTVAIVDQFGIGLWTWGKPIDYCYTYSKYTIVCIHMYIYCVLRTPVTCDIDTRLKAQQLL